MCDYTCLLDLFSCVWFYSSHLFSRDYTSSTYFQIIFQTHFTWFYFISWFFSKMIYSFFQRILLGFYMILQPPLLHNTVFLDLMFSGYYYNSFSHMIFCSLPFFYMFSLPACWARAVYLWFIILILTWRKHSIACEMNLDCLWGHS